MEKLEHSLKRKAELRREGDHDNGERVVWLAGRVSQVAPGPDSWTVSQNLVANVENAGSSKEAAEIERFIIISSRLVFGDSPTRGSDSAEMFNGDSVRDLNSANAPDSSSDSDWEWNTLVQGLPSAQWCSSCNGYQALTHFKGLKQGGFKLYKTCNGCREKKRRPVRRKDVQHPNVTATERRELALSKREPARSKCLRKLPEHALTDFDSSDFDALAEYYGDSDSSDFETFYIQQILDVQRKGIDDY